MARYMATKYTVGLIFYKTTIMDIVIINNEWITILPGVMKLNRVWAGATKQNETKPNARINISENFIISFFLLLQFFTLKSGRW